MPRTSWPPGRITATDWLLAATNVVAAAGMVLMALGHRPAAVGCLLPAVALGCAYLFRTMIELAG